MTMAMFLMREVWLIWDTWLTWATKSEEILSLWIRMDGYPRQAIYYKRICIQTKIKCVLRP